jgi:hypothetical protein
LIVLLCLGLVLIGIARLAGIAYTPQLVTVAAFLSAVIIVIAEAVRKLSDFEHLNSLQRVGC